MDGLAVAVLALGVRDTGANRLSWPWFLTPPAMNLIALTGIVHAEFARGLVARERLSAAQRARQYFRNLTAWAGASE